MNSPSETALSLVEKYRVRDGYYLPRWIAQQHAIIACDLVIEALNEISLEESGTTKIDYGQSHYEEVKNEINKL